MSVYVEILTGPLGPLGPLAAPPPSSTDHEVGARVTFEGIVRGTEYAKPLAALDYETYEPMAQRSIESLALEFITRHQLRSITVRHSRGRVPVGQCSFQLVITAAHREPALAAMAEFIDRLKQDVPIWKKAVWA